MILDTRAQVHRSSWMTPAECLAYYKVRYQFREIQIHWWNDPSTKPTHQGVVDYIANKTGGSVNYVASAGRVTTMIPEENCALTTQGGNPYGVKIECSPYGTAEDYETIGWLIAQIWKRRGKLPLVPHKKYWSTACPGTLDLNRMAQVAEKYYKGEGMIDANSTNLLRIVHSEVGGWDFQKTHNGEYDKIFHSAWDGKDEDAFVYAQWIDKNAQATRAFKYEAMTKYPEAKRSVEALTKVVETKDQTISAQQKEIESLKSQVGDNSKWETLKALLRELLGIGGSN